MLSDERSTPTEGKHESTGISRRRFLTTTAAAVVGTTGLGATAGVAAADSDQIMEVDLRNGVPPVSAAPQGEDEVVFHIHGYTGSSASVSQARQFQRTARDLGYSETVTAVTWDDSGYPFAAIRSAREAGGTFATWFGNYLDENPDTNIRVLGHSMGGIVQMETLAGIGGAFKIETADSIGSYAEADAPCQGNFYQDIADSCAEASTYYSTNDGIARLGQSGASCSGPPNYQDVNVSDSVSSHLDYKSSPGCVSEIINNYTADIDRTGSDGGSGGDGGGNDDGGSGGDGGGNDGDSGSGGNDDDYWWNDDDDDYWWNDDDDNSWWSDNGGDNYWWT
jgi:uncharacterized membrane protein YgcG